jgi:hypothetical protein
MQDWLSMVRQASAAGKRFARVRVVDLPLSDYNAFGLALSAQNNAAGEDIRYLVRDQAAALPGHDYWLFDSRKLLRMHFDDGDDRFTHSEIVDEPSEVVRHNYWRDVAWHHAVRRDDFASQQRIERL